MIDVDRTLPVEPISSRNPAPTRQDASGGGGVPIMMDAAEIKRRVTIDTILRHYGSVQDREGRWRCLFPERHHNGDAHHSVTAKDDRASCWSQQCFGEKGADQFELVRLMENLPTFADQKRLVMEIGGIVNHRNGNRRRRIIRRFLWTDANDRTAWHLRWELGDPRFTWAQDQDGKRSGLGVCRPTLRNLNAVREASTVIICEGEHDQETVDKWLKELNRYGETVATTTPNGAADVKVEYLVHLDGKACVVLTGDNDEAGGHYVKRCYEDLPAVQQVRRLMSPAEHKDWHAWKEAGATAQDFVQLLDQAEPYPVEVEQIATATGPWSKARTAKDFLGATRNDVPMLEAHLLARGSLTEVFSPRGIGKTHIGHYLAVKHAKLGRRVLLLDRDNSQRELARRLRAWGADGLETLKVMTRDDVPPLTDAEKWRVFPFQDYVLVLIDSLESSMEGCGEQDSAKPSKAIASLLDIAHRDNGPAILVLGNTIKSAKHCRGSGIVEDRADVSYEVRDATALTPSGMKDWWLELPPAGAEEWASRASRRKQRNAYRLAFIPSKYRLGGDPDPFIWEIAMPDDGESWMVRDVTTDVVKAGEAAKQAADTELRAALDRAALALADQVRQMAEAGDPMLSETEAVPYLKGEHDLKRKDARQIIKDKVGTLWDIEQGRGKGHPQILVPVKNKTNVAAKMPNEDIP